MKKYLKPFILLLSLTVLLILSGCGSTKTETQKVKGNDKRVLDAIEIISAHWSEAYEESSLNIEDKYLEIINTRIINIKNNIDTDETHGKDSYFKGVDYIVEFDLISNYFDSAPYYSNVMQNNSVVVYKDGTAKVSNNLFNIYRSITYSNDFSPIIESIEDLHGEYDQVLELN